MRTLLVFAILVGAPALAAAAAEDPPVDLDRLVAEFVAARGLDPSRLTRTPVEGVMSAGGAYEVSVAWGIGDGHGSGFGWGHGSPERGCAHAGSEDVFMGGIVMPFSTCTPGGASQLHRLGVARTTLVCGGTGIACATGGVNDEPRDLGVWFIVCPANGASMTPWGEGDPLATPKCSIVGYGASPLRWNHWAGLVLRGGPGLVAGTYA